MPKRQQAVRQVAADKSGRPGDETFWVIKCHSEPANTPNTGKFKPIVRAVRAGESGGAIWKLATHHPGGMADNSPTFQPWGRKFGNCISPEGTAECVACF